MKRSIIEQLYRKVNGSTTGLEERLTGIAEAPKTEAPKTDTDPLTIRVDAPKETVYWASSKPTSTCFGVTTTGRFTSLPSCVSHRRISSSLALSTFCFPSAR